MKRSSFLPALAAGALLIAAQGPAFAVGTAAGTNVDNQASVDYVVSGVNQPDVTSNTDSFLVDRRINLTVAEVGDDFTDVVPGAQNEALKFTVTNSTNATVDFRLTYTQDSGTAGPAAPHAAGGANDAFDTTSVEFYEDDGDGVFDAGDTLVTFLNDVPADATRTVFVVSDIPSTPTPGDGDLSSGTLTAIASSDASGGSGNDYTETAGADTQGSVDTVLGDGAGDADSARDGKHSDDDAYRVRRAVLSITKSSRVISDPFNNTTNPKRIPGAVLEYCIDVENTGSRDADTVVISDVLQVAEIEYSAGSIRTAATGTGTGCDSGTGAAEDDNDTDADETGDGADYNVTTANAVTVRTASIASGGGRFKALFRVTVK